MDLTDQFEQYRECSRMIWNTFLRKDADPQRLLAFDRVREVLFAELVLGVSGNADYQRSDVMAAVPLIEVRPRLAETPIMIQRIGTMEPGYWDDPTKTIGPNGCRLLYVDVFDWDQLGYRDLRFVMAKIVDHNDRPDLVGRLALLDALQVELIGPNP